MTTNPTMDLDEFQQVGFLQEANRLFFHPLGLALAINRDDEGVQTYLSVLDYRDDPEGYLFKDLTSIDSAAKASRIESLLIQHVPARKKLLGSIIQDLGSKIEDDED